MARLQAPEGYTPSGRSEAEIRGRIGEIPWIFLTNPLLSNEAKEALRLVWWEEIALMSKDDDEEAARLEHTQRNQQADIFQIARFFLTHK